MNLVHQPLHKYINSLYLSIPIPYVVKLKNYLYVKPKQLALTRNNIIKRDNSECQYCGKTNIVLTIDHVIPKNKGGDDTWENLVSACVKCNLKKADSSLKDINMNLINKPKKPHYLIYMQEHVSNEYESWKPYLYMS